MFKASLTAIPDHAVGTPDKMLFGSFIEHIGRAVYGGIYDPGHPSDDGFGFRGDVGALIHTLGATAVRYPGGNFVSGYNWEDGVGPREKRPRAAELAWFSTEPNLVGTDEFLPWCERLGLEPIMAVNLGTRGMEAARDLVEYCALPGGTRYADMRRANGRDKPYSVKYWCLGNEMDGEWQIGHKTAAEYGRLAHETAKAMRMIDPDIKLTACGSSSPGMSTFPEWEDKVLSECYDSVDFVSLHSYYSNASGDTGSFLAAGVQAEKYINDVISVCDYVKSKRRSRKTMMLSFDEYNVWYHSGGTKYERFSVAPPINEDVYDAADVPCLGGVLLALLRSCGRVKCACLAQLVNVIAPIMTETGGRAWAQTIFYPFADFAACAGGTVLHAPVSSDSYECRACGKTPLVDAVPIIMPSGSLCVLAVNRSQTSEALLSVGTPCSLPLAASHTAVFSSDAAAVNTAEHPFTVVPRAMQAPEVSGRGISVCLPPLSWNKIVITEK